MVIHVGRNPESIVYKDRDVIAFIPDVLTQDSVKVVAKKESGSATVYAMTTADTPLKTNRVLMYGRTLLSGDIANGLHVCFYYDPDTGATCIKPLREIISPRVSYDKDSNTITMWFWTNFRADPGENYTDDPAYLAYYDENKGVWDKSGDKYDLSFPVIRALCSAVGAIEQLSLTGGDVVPVGGGGSSSSASASSSSGVMDLIPVFQKPTLVAKRPVEVYTGDLAAGLPILDFTGGASGGLVDLYKAVANASGGFIDTKRVDSDGVVTGDIITLKVPPA